MLLAPAAAQQRRRALPSHQKAVVRGCGCYVLFVCYRRFAPLLLLPTEAQLQQPPQSVSMSCEVVEKTRSPRSVAPRHDRRLPLERRRLLPRRLANTRFSSLCACWRGKMAEGSGIAAWPSVTSRRQHPLSSLSSAAQRTPRQSSRRTAKAVLSSHPQGPSRASEQSPAARPCVRRAPSSCPPSRHRCCRRQPRVENSDLGATESACATARRQTLKAKVHAPVEGALDLSHARVMDVPAHDAFGADTADGIDHPARRLPHIRSSGCEAHAIAAKLTLLRLQAEAHPRARPHRRSRALLPPAPPHARSCQSLSWQTQPIRLSWMRGSST